MPIDSSHARTPSAVSASAKSRHPVALGEVQRTLLVPLWARAKEQSVLSPLLRDPLAPQVLASLDWDARLLDQARASQLGCVVRAAQIDQWICSFVAEHPEATIVELGVGLNTRAMRLREGLSRSVRWYEVDLPDVMSLRDQCIARQENCVRISADLRDLSSLRALLSAPNRSTLVVAEGVLVYLAPNEVRSLLRWLVRDLGAHELIFDCMAPIVRTLQGLHDAMRHFDARFTWEIADISELTRWEPSLRIADNVSFYALLFVHAERLPRWMRWARPLVERAYPQVRDVYRVLRLTA
ncbi:MAG: class I SAM-dependent methyltransferase [Deltaproteobacteria bacterium]|nr:class I SAM-dependent methyltransferase [Deltaproteobacteria bacterium]